VDALLRARGSGAFTLHELRHSALDRIYRETGDLYAAKQLARHAAVRTTEEYLHPNADDLPARMLESDGGKACISPLVAKPLGRRMHDNGRYVKSENTGFAGRFHPAAFAGPKKFAEPVSVSSTAFADLSLAGSAFELGFDLLRFRARRKWQSRGRPRPVQGVPDTQKPQFAEIQLSTFPQQGVQLVDNPP